MCKTETAEWDAACPPMRTNSSLAGMTLNLATLFEAVAVAVPDRTVLVCGDRRLTFADLDARADAVAGRCVRRASRRASTWVSTC